jgi:hypothetical protein
VINYEKEKLEKESKKQLGGAGEIDGPKELSKL